MRSPVVRNDFDEEIHVHVDYDNGASRDWRAKPGGCVIVGIMNSRPTELTAETRDTQRLELG
jgi:hypothetical protein